MSLFGRDRILAMIPHAGTMCLLDDVLAFDAISVRCASRRYAQADNPLRRACGALGTASGIELAAQAMAVHGRLRAGDGAPPRPGRLVALRDVRLTAPLLATGSELIITATCLMGDSASAAYAFSVMAAGSELLGGRATVLFGDLP